MNHLYAWIMAEGESMHCVNIFLNYIANFPMKIHRNFEIQIPFVTSIRRN